jgi:hypothetical protein
VGGNRAVSDGSFIPVNVSWESRTEVRRGVEKSSVDYLETLERELWDTEGYSEAPVEVVEKKELKSGTDTECGYIH